MNLYEEEFMAYMADNPQETLFSGPTSKPFYGGAINTASVLKAVGTLALIPLVVVGFMLSALCSKR